MTSNLNNLSKLKSDRQIIENNNQKTFKKNDQKTINQINDKIIKFQSNNRQNNYLNEKQLTSSTTQLTNLSTQLLSRFGWFSNIFGCLTPILNSIRFNKSQQQTDDWIVSSKSITNLIYLNAGSQGSVYKGQFKNRTIAVKSVQLNELNEVDNLRKLKHNNIIRFIGICKSPSYILMEFCPLGNLTDFLKKKMKTIEPELIWEFAFQITSGMNYLHYNSIIHRDLKSANILVNDDYQLKICDFGVCKKFDNLKSSKMTFVGTCAWIAPEIIRNDEKCTEKIDVYSFGVVLWELLTCEIPYSGVDNSRIMHGVARNQIKLPITSECPEGFKILIELCLSIQPNTRPSFKQILLHLQMFCKEFMTSLSLKKFNEIKFNWRKEIKLIFDSLANRSIDEERNEKLESHRLELEQTIKLSKGVLDLYKEKLNHFSEICHEINNLLISLKEREKELNVLLAKEKSNRFDS